MQSKLSGAMAKFCPRNRSIGLKAASWWWSRSRLQRRSEWRDDPESIAAWIVAVEKLEPMIWAEGEREEYERYRKELRQFNIEAVRQQMMSGVES